MPVKLHFSVFAIDVEASLAFLASCHSKQILVNNSQATDTQSASFKANTHTTAVQITLMCRFPSIFAVGIASSGNSLQYSEKSADDVLSSCKGVLSLKQTLVFSVLETQMPNV